MRLLYWSANIIEDLILIFFYLRIMVIIFFWRGISHEKISVSWLPAFLSHIMYHFYYYEKSQNSVIISEKILILLFQFKKQISVSRLMSLRLFISNKNAFPLQSSSRYHHFSYQNQIIHLDYYRSDFLLAFHWIRNILYIPH